MDGVWVPPGTMERTSPSYHPSLSESFIAARCICIHIYECYIPNTYIQYIRIYILYICYPVLPKTLPLVYLYISHTVYSCPTNQDLSLLPIVTDATRARTPVYLAIIVVGVSIICVTCCLVHTYEHAFSFHEFNCLVNLNKKSSFFKPKYVY